MKNSSSEKTDELKFKMITRKMASEMKRLSIPGAAVGIWQAGRQFEAGLGVTSIEHPLKVTPETLFQVGSITKTLTGTVLMMLAEQGMLNLDAPVRSILPKFKLQSKKTAKKVTTRHLLTHTGGWVGDYFNDFGNGENALKLMVKDIARLDQVMLPGKIWSYNNTGFNIAARVVEVVTGKSYEAAVQEMLLVPLNLRKSFFYPDDALLTERVAVGHYLQDGSVRVARPWAIGRASNGVGGLVSTVQDLLAYARFQMGDGNGIIQQQTLQAMRVPQVSMGRRGEMGLTWFITPGAVTRYSHGGATHGQQAAFLFIPELDFAMAILTNSEQGGSMNSQVLALALKEFCGMEGASPALMDMPESALQEFVGRYQIGTEAFSLKVEGGMLMYYPIPLGGFPTPDSPPMPAHAPVRIAFYEPDQVMALDEPLLNALGDFLRDEAGQVQFLRIGSRAHLKKQGRAMKKSIIQTALASLATGALLFACQAPAKSSVEAQIATAAALTVQAVLSEVPPSTRPAPTQPALTPTPVISTATFVQPMASVEDVTNCRTGPGLNYEKVTQLMPLEAVKIVGFYPPNYYVVSTSSGECWLSGEFATPSGSFAAVPTVTAPPTPQGELPLAAAFPQNAWTYFCHEGKVDITLNWIDKANNETGYRIVRNGEEIVELSADSTHFEETTDLPSGKKVVYLVRAYNESGQADSPAASISCP